MYELLTLGTIIAYLITAVLFFVNAFIKEWFAGSAKNSQVTYEFSYGLLKLCVGGNNTCIDYDDVEGMYNQVFTEFNIIYYALLVGGSFSALAFLLMLVQTKSRKRTNHYKVFLGLRYASNVSIGVALGGAIWMEYRLFKVKLNKGYDPSVGLTYDMKRTDGYIMSWITTCVCVIAAVIGSIESYIWKEHFKTPNTVVEDVQLV